MDDIPPPLIDGLSATGRRTVRAWWRGLADASRAEVIALWDDRLDARFFGLDSDDAPAVLGGRFVPRDDMAGWTEWRAEHFDYLINRPEIEPFPPRQRTFHICSAHEAIRVTFATGRLPAGFRCPLDSAGCPVRRSLGLARE